MPLRILSVLQFSWERTSYKVNLKLFIRVIKIYWKQIVIVASFGDKIALTTLLIV